MRRHSRPLTETKPHGYHVVRTTVADEERWLSEDQAKALAHLQRLQQQGPLTREQQALLQHLLKAS